MVKYDKILKVDNPRKTFTMFINLLKLENDEGLKNKLFSGILLYGLACLLEQMKND